MGSFSWSSRREVLRHRLYSTRDEVGVSVPCSCIEKYRICFWYFYLTRLVACCFTFIIPLTN
ncbi:hypothetical protein BJX70DRAFT_371459 [Aspergillus crustosus]